MSESDGLDKPDKKDAEKAAAATLGAASGAAIGAAIGGPPGAILGAATGTVRGVAVKDAADKVEERSERPPDERRQDEHGVSDRVADAALDLADRARD